jgi:putative transposase
VREAKIRENLARQRSEGQFVADSLEEAGDRLLTFTRFPAGPMKVDPHLERDRAPARGVQAPRQDPDHPALLLWALLASGLIALRKVDGWQTLAGRPADPIIDLAA